MADITDAEVRDRQGLAMALVFANLDNLDAGDECSEECSTLMSGTSQMELGCALFVLARLVALCARDGTTLHRPFLEKYAATAQQP